MNVLILEDEKPIRDFVRINLKRAGFEVIEAATGETAIEAIKLHPEIDMAVLDVMLPGMDGFEVCACLRKLNPRIGIIMLTARGQEVDKITGLDLGADDYIVKPFSPGELVARLNSLYRRLYPADNLPEEPVLVSPPFRVLLDQRKLMRGEQTILLTPKEFDIIKLLMENPNKAIHRDEILNTLWGRFFTGDMKIVDVNIRRIRQKIEKDDAKPEYIETVWGYGYLWRTDPCDEGN
ncbi:response regulator transcription factor [Paenibacillus wulumuqiensis]|uniref:response regulator transcription factor n=1 Tax=Paenibacillus wulumuqiensis TaxID=1567107 RepID=UPI000619FA10|nr:response regulator transcription factor [Paenibacillus wulumuqiensis]